MNLATKLSLLTHEQPLGANEIPDAVLRSGEWKGLNPEHTHSRLQAVASVAG